MLRGLALSSTSVRNRNACHRITTDIVRRIGTIAVEALRISNMVKSAKGTVEQPGTHVAQKRGLNRSIQEQTWGLLRQQLAYKAAWAGRRFVEVNPAYAPRTCSRCARRTNPKTSETFRCGHCRLVMERDVNAATNILRAGEFALAARRKCDI